MKAPCIYPLLILLALLTLLLPVSASAADPVYCCLAGNGDTIDLYINSLTEPDATFYSGIAIEALRLSEKSQDGWILLECTLNQEEYFRCSVREEALYMGGHYDLEDPELRASLNHGYPQARLTADCTVTLESCGRATRLPKGLEVAVLGFNARQYYVLVQGGSGAGWVERKYVSLTGNTVNVIQDPLPDEMPELPAVQEQVTLYGNGANSIPCHTTTDRTVISGFYDSGDTVDLLGRFGSWSLIRNSAADAFEKACFVENRFLSAKGDHSINQKYVITSSESNRLLLRAKPNQNADYTAKLFAGTRITVESRSGKWSKVRITAPEQYSFEGYVMNEYLADTPGEVRTVTAIYEGSSSQNARSFLYRKYLNTTVTLIASCKADMWFIAYDGRLLSDTIDSFRIPDENMDQLARTTSNVKLRSLADQASVDLATVKKGRTVTVLIQGDEWSQVYYDDRIGYMMTRYLSFK